MFGVCRFSVAVDAEIAPALVVGKDDDDVGFRIRRVALRAQTEQESNRG